MKHFFILAVLFISTNSLFSMENISIFVDLRTCITCESLAIKKLSDNAKKEDIPFQIVISDLRKNQYEYALKTVKKEFNAIKILVDTSNTLAKKHSIEKYPSICYFSNDELLFVDNSFIHTEVFDFINFQNSSIKLDETITPLFKVDLVCKDNNNIYMLDGFTKNIVKYDLDGNQLKTIGYGHLKYNLISADSTLLNPRYFRVSASHFGFKGNKPYLFTMLPYLNFVSDDIEVNIPKYKVSLIDISNLEVETLSSDDHISFYGNYSDKLKDGYFFQTYDNVYHHNKHDAVKDSTTVFSIFYKDKFEKVFSITDIESYTNSLYTYGFPSRHIKLNDNNIFILNEYSNLFGLVTIDSQKKKYNINTFAPERILKETMDYLSQINKFDFLNHKPITQEEIFSVVDIIQYDNKFGLFIVKNENRIPKYLYYQEYDDKGSFIKETKVRLYCKSSDPLKQVIMVRALNPVDVSFILNYQESGYSLFKPMFSMKNKITRID